GGPASVFIVTTSPSRDWVICAPAAFLRSGSRFSGSLSGIEPRFSVTRDHHGKPLPYHRKLIGRKFERIIAGAGPCDSRSYRESPKVGRGRDGKGEPPPPPRSPVSVWVSNKYGPSGTREGEPPPAPVGL